ncbi:MAG: hypothetical protein GX238_11165 [Epulopiscium sp.]|jgi:hypothetical protein|nr:hypothetical protein [Candidatus Epulonipiscium sp.]
MAMIKVEIRATVERDRSSSRTEVFEATVSEETYRKSQNDLGRKELGAWLKNTYFPTEYDAKLSGMRKI